MPGTKIYEGAVGQIILADMVDVVTGATDIEFRIKRDDGTEDAWVATVSGTTKFSYTTLDETDLRPGNILVQPHFTLGGWTGYGEPFTITVLPKFSGG